MDLAKFISEARKFLVALVAALGVLAIAMGDHVVTPTEWLQIALAFAGALGVYAVPNQSQK